MGRTPHPQVDPRGSAHTMCRHHTSCRVLHLLAPSSSGVPDVGSLTSSLLLTGLLSVGDGNPCCLSATSRGLAGYTSGFLDRMSCSNEASPP